MSIPRTILSTGYDRISGIFCPVNLREQISVAQKQKCYEQKQFEKERFSRVTGFRKTQHFNLLFIVVKFFLREPFIF
jgi:hypothetical protein